MSPRPSAALRPVINYVIQAQESYTSSPIPPTASNSSFGASLGVSADMLLWDFGSSKLGIKAAQETVLATREGLQQVEQSVLLTAVQAYMNVIRATESVALNQNNYDLISQELQSAKDRFELGELTRTDVALAESQLAISAANLAAARRGSSVVRARISRPRPAIIRRR